MKIIYTPTALPVRCNKCKAIFVPNEIGDIEHAPDRAVTVCPNCSAYCDVDFVDDPEMDVFGKEWLDVRKTPPSNGDIILAIVGGKASKYVATVFCNDAATKSEEKWIAVPLGGQDCGPFLFTSYKKL